MWDSVNSSSGFTYSAIEFMVLWQTRNHRAIKKKCILSQSRALVSVLVYTYVPC